MPLLIQKALLTRQDKITIMYEKKTNYCNYSQISNTIHYTSTIHSMVLYAEIIAC